MPGIRIKLIDGPDGEKHVPTEVMDLLLRFGGHRDYCEQCANAQKFGKADGYCKVGHEILAKLAEQPEVSEEP